MDTKTILSRHYRFALFCIVSIAVIAPTMAYADSQQEQPDACSCRLEGKHWGDDWKGKTGMPVPVAQDGIVIRIEQRAHDETGKKRDESGCGQYVVVEHEYPGGRMVYTRYAQLGKVEEANGEPLKVGQRVKQGQIIGKIGDIGLFHFEVRPVSSRDEKSRDKWQSIPPVNPNNFDFDAGVIQEAQGFHWDSYKAEDIDSIYESDMKLESPSGAGQKIWSPLRKLHFKSALLAYPQSCKLNNLGYALSVNGVSLQNLPPISTCIRLKSPKGREFSVFIQDQVGSFLPREVKLGEQVDLYVAYIYADEISKSLGMVVNEYKKVEQNKAASQKLGVKP
jgi:hypothetical protein